MAYLIIAVLVVACIIMHNDKEDFIRKSLKDYFSDDVTEKLIKLAFKEYSE